MIKDIKESELSILFFCLAVAAISLMSIMVIMSYQIGFSKGQNDVLDKLIAFQKQFSTI